MGACKINFGMIQHKVFTTLISKYIFYEYFFIFFYVFTNLTLKKQAHKVSTTLVSTTYTLLFLNHAIAYRYLPHKLRNVDLSLHYNN